MSAERRSFKPANTFARLEVVGVAVDATAAVAVTDVISVIAISVVDVITIVSAVGVDVVAVGVDVMTAVADVVVADIDVMSVFEFVVGVAVSIVVTVIRADGELATGLVVVVVIVIGAGGRNKVTILNNTFLVILYNIELPLLLWCCSKRDQ